MTDKENQDKYLRYEDVLNEGNHSVNSDLYEQEHRLWSLSQDLSMYSDQTDILSKEKLYDWFAIVEDVAREIHMIREGIGSGAYRGEDK